MAFNPGNIIISLVILILGIALGSFAGRVVRRAIITLDLKKYFKVQIDLIASRVTAYLIYALSVILALINLGIATPILYAIIIILLVLIGAAVFLALKDFIPNVVAGAALQRRNIHKGLRVKFGNISGKVEEFTITETKIRSGNDILYVPNSLLAKEILYVKDRKRRKK